MPDTASQLTLKENSPQLLHYFVSAMHRKDWEYRGFQDRNECSISDVSQYFPFHGSPTQVLRYLLWNLEESDPVLSPVRPTPSKFCVDCKSAV
jgi:hypothetical protein